MSATVALVTLRMALADLRSNALTDRAFIQTARSQEALFKALPPKFEEVWLELVDRLESSALFSEESCSFSQTDLLDNLALVLDKAEAKLTAPENFEIFTVKVEPAGLQYDVEGDLTLLEAAELSRIELPSSCRNGTCRTCVCRLVSGEVTYTIEWPGLSAEEKAEGYVLPCVARPTSNVVLEQTQARAT